VQFTSDPRTFVDAALTVREVDDPVLPTADAWVEVTVEEVASETEGDTTIRTGARSGRARGRESAFRQ